MPPGSIYSTPDAAAIAALNEIMATSRGMNREYGGRVYMNMDGTFSYTTPIQGAPKSLPSTKAHPTKSIDWDWYPLPDGDRS
jgi:ABC-type glycerol-3-phosphate transport system substrate-binding protein